MSKFHINAKGVPAPCKAMKGNCPFGGADSHFDTAEAAQISADKSNEANHGILPEVNVLPPVKERREMRFKEVKLTMKDGSEVAGVSVGSEDDNISIRPDGDYHNIIKISTDEVANMEVTSTDTTYSQAYRDNLRKQNKARAEFRFAESQLKGIGGKFVQAKYDGKDFDGEVIGIHYEDFDNNGLIVEDENGNVKHIKAYRLTDLEETGDNIREHKQTVRLKVLEDEIADNVLANYDSEPEYSDNTDFQSPTEEINKYFRAVIENKRGGNVDLDKITYDWSAEVDETKDSRAYDDSSMYYHDFNKGGGQYAEWSDASQEAYEDDLNKADKMDEFYEDRKSAINDMVKTVENIDWTQYYDTQQEGEIEALEYLNDIGMATDV